MAFTVETEARTGWGLYCGPRNVTLFSEPVTCVASDSPHLDRPVFAPEFPPVKPRGRGGHREGSITFFVGAPREVRRPWCSIPRSQFGRLGEHTMHVVSKRARFLPKRGVYIIAGPSLDGTEPRVVCGGRRVLSVPAMRVYDLPRYDFDLPGVAFLRRVRVVGRSFRMRV